MTNEITFTRDFKTKAKGRFKCRIKNADGSTAYEDPTWCPNLILDCGMEKIAFIPWATAFQWCVSGTGTTPVKRTSDATTAAQSGTTVTASGGTFVFAVDDVGRIIYFPTAGVQARITAFTSTTVVTVDVSQSVSAQAFNVYSVEQTALVTPYSMSMRYETGAGMCGTTVTDELVKMLRTYDFYMENTPVLITELGFLEAPHEATLFSRVLVPTPLYLHAGQYLQVSYELTVTLAPATPNAKTASITGWPISPATSTDGDEQIQLLGMATVDEDGIAQPADLAGVCNEPFAPGSTLLGPQFGYVNRWQNADASSPVKIYANAYANPFVAVNRNYKLNYVSSGSKNYIVNSGSAPTPNPWFNNTRPLILSDLMQPVISPPGFSTTDPQPWNGIDPYVHFPSAVPTTGDSSWDNWTDPNNDDIPVSGASVFLSEVSTALADVGSCVDRSSACVEVPLVVEPYVANSNEIIKKGTFMTNIANRTTWRVLGIGPTDVSVPIIPRINAAKYNGFVFLFDEAQTKLNTHVLNVYFKYSWTRDLSNT